MPRQTKAQQEARQDAIERLREIIHPGDTVYTVLRHVSRSGMMRHIDCYVMQDNEPRWISSLVSKAIDTPQVPNGDALKVGGCGMDMGFAVVYDLSQTLFRDGFDCIGQGDGYKRRCPSADHSNGDRDYTPHRHASGGYALRHQWM